MFHVLNAYDDGDRVVMDVIRYDRAFDTEPGERHRLGAPRPGPVDHRPGAGRVAERRLDDVPVEFPRIDDAVAGLPHRYGYCVRLGDRGRPARASSAWSSTTWPATSPPGSTRASTGSPGSRSSCGPPTDAAEDEGWVLSVVYDASTDRSDLVILDATSFAGPPVATVHLPARVPFGFHGSWVPVDS